MDDQWTCGKGVAANAVLPEQMAAVLAAMAENLRIHMRALDPSEPDARAEREAYQDVLDEQRRAVAQLTTVARKMASYRDLPMAEHDMQAMQGPDVGQAFQTLVDREADLRALLERRQEEHRALLDQLAAGAPPPG